MSIHILLYRDYSLWVRGQKSPTLHTHQRRSKAFRVLVIDAPTYFAIHPPSTHLKVIPGTGNDKIFDNSYQKFIF